MTRTSAVAARPLVGALHLLPRILPRALVVTVALVTVVTAGLAIAVALASPAAGEVARALAAGTGAAVLPLIATSVWLLLPVVLLLAGAVVYVGLIVQYGDGALSGRRVSSSAALARAVRRLGSGAAVAVVLFAVALLGLFLAPLWSLLALAALLGGRRLRAAVAPRLLPTPGQLGWLVIPFVAGLAVASRLALAPVDVVLADRGSRAALRASWERTSGATRAAATTVLAAGGGTLLLSVGLTAIGTLAGSAIAEFVLNFAASVLLSPVLWLAIVVLNRHLGGTAFPLRADEPVAAQSPRGRVGRAVPAALAVAVAATMLQPTASATAAPTASASTGTETAVVTLDGATPDTRTWVWADPTLTISGSVTSAAAESPDGLVELWRLAAGSSTAEKIAGPVPLDGGTFSFTSDLILSGVATVYVTYSGDDVHTPASSTAQAINVTKRDVPLQAVKAFPANDPVVGEFVTITATLDPMNMMAISGPYTGEIVVFDSDTSVELGRAPVVNKQASVSFRITRRSQQVVVALEGDPRFRTVGSGDSTFSAAPAATTTTLSAPAGVIVGDTGQLVVEVKAPTGVPVAGHLSFSGSVSAGADMWFENVSVPTDGIARVSFCVGESTTQCPTAPRFIAPTGTEKLTLRALFVPDPDDVNTRSLERSESSTITIEAQPAGSGGTSECAVTRPFAWLDDRVDVSDADRASAGRVEVSPGSNCTTQLAGSLAFGHRGGTLMTLNAIPRTGFDFVAWRVGSEIIGTTRTLVWRMPEGYDAQNVDLMAVFRPQCLRISLAIDGYARESRFGASGSLGPRDHCTPAGGGTGAYYGSEVSYEVVSTTNPATGEGDRFYAARASTALTVTNPNPGIARIRFTAARDTVLSVEYGPMCRAVDTSADNALLWGAPSPRYRGAGTPELTTDPNCSSPFGDGYLRNSEVTLRAAVDDDDLAVSGWRVDGRLMPELGAVQEVRVAVGLQPTTHVGFDTVDCYAIDLRETPMALPNGTHAQGGAVDISPSANCPDGTGRWLGGTRVTLTPRAATADVYGMEVKFAGWSDSEFDESGALLRQRSTAHDYRDVDYARDRDDNVLGDIAANGRRTIVLEGSLVTQAHFYVPAACSTLRMRGEIRLAELVVDDGGCGPGRYFDRARANLPADGRVDGQAMTREHYADNTDRYPYTELRISMPQTPLMLSGTVELEQHAPAGATGWVWFDDTTLTCDDGICTALVRGDVIMKLDACQVLDPTVHLRVVGDESETVYSPEQLGLEEHEWIVSDTPGCGGAGWLPGTTVALRGNSPGLGFEFGDWGHVPNAIGLEAFFEQAPNDPRSPFAVHVETDAEASSIPVEVTYWVHCATLELGGSIAIVSPAPTCPGARGLSYVIGTFVQVAAQEQNYEGRYFEGFRNAIAGTRGTLLADSADFAATSDNARDRWNRYEEREYPSALAIVDSSKQIYGYYQFEKHNWDQAMDALPKAGKFMVGTLSVALGAAIGLCPPCAGALALLQASEYLFRLLPDGGLAASLMAMVNPLNFLSCSAGWGFDTLDGSPSDGSIPIDDGEMALGKIGGGAAITSLKSHYIGNEVVTNRLNKISSTVKYGGTAATFAVGMWQAELDEFDWGGANRTELRDTDAFVSCLGDTWKDPSEGRFSSAPAPGGHPVSALDPTTPALASRRM